MPLPSRSARRDTLTGVREPRPGEDLPKPIPHTGQDLGRYRLKRELGRGGMGVVFLAVDSQLERQVALKLIAPEISGDDRFRLRFARETRIAAQLEHPNIVPVYEAGEADGLLFIAMRYVDGEDLRKRLRRDGKIAAVTASELGQQLGAALDAAHGRGLVHRDIKPANILLGNAPTKPHLYLSDFGLARQALSDTSLTSTGQWMGTIDYVAPEQLDGGPINARTDIYAMACVLFEILSGRVPFEGSVARKLYAHAHEVLPSVGSAAGPQAAAIDEVLQRAAAKAPDDRYASAGALSRAMSAALAQAAARDDEPTLPIITAPAARPAPGSLRASAPYDTDRTLIDERHRRASTSDRETVQLRGSPQIERRRSTSIGAAVLAALVTAAAVAIILFLNGNAPKHRSIPRQAAVTHATAVIVRVTTPTPGTVVTSDLVNVAGTVAPPNAAVEVQGTSVEVKNGAFFGTVQVPPGSTTISVIGSAQGAAPDSVSVSVVRAASGSGTASALSARRSIPATTGRSVTFQSPSGNIACSLQGDGAVCSVASVNESFVLPEGVGAAYTQPGAAVSPATGAVAAYGTSVSNGPVTCDIPVESSPQGITCRNSESGHGFEASRVPARQQTF